MIKNDLSHRCIILILIFGGFILVSYSFDDPMKRLHDESATNNEEESTVYDVWLSYNILLYVTKTGDKKRMNKQNVLTEFVKA